ncbi:hypothetical protein [Undibacterium sp.]|uniref:hypothetical protein n=1 Tax=Undibacterium sp. TaxID=1914977 RepID=UPI00272F13C9|nr:hypothetical protein [Undibacterium sp.]MDP1976270.1 hypothetical protein [Undibacterium sp.]
MRAIRFFLLPFLLVACTASEKEQNVINNEGISPAAKSANVLPIKLTHGFVTNMLQGQKTKATIVATVDAGNKDDWTTTAIVLAEQVAKLGIDMVEVTLDRNDLGELATENRYKHYVRVSYAPDLNRSTAFERNWEIAVAEDVVSKKMILATNQYHDLYGKYVQAGMNGDKADKKAGAAVAKDFDLAPDWRLPLGNLADTKLSRADFFIKSEPQNFSAIEKIIGCLKNKMNFTIKSCE